MMGDCEGTSSIGRAAAASFLSLETFGLKMGNLILCMTSFFSLKLGKCWFFEVLLESGRSKACNVN